MTSVHQTAKQLREPTVVLPTLIPTLSPAPLPDEILAGDGLLRAEIFSTQQLIRHGRDLAGWHRLEVHRGGNQLLQRLRDNESTLREVLEELVENPASAPLSASLVPAGDWLLDNQHLIIEQIATARRHLPRGYSRELPRLTTGDPAGAPRVYALSIELIAHADGRVDADSLSAFIAAYQEIAPLTLGELWAVPIMLRLALIENLRRVAVRVAGHEEQRRLAARWAARLGQIADEQPSSLVIIISELARTVVLSQAFVAELHRRVQGLNPQVALVMQWLDQRLADHHQTVTDLVRADHQVQAGDQLAVEHAITSLRRMASIDWRAFVEEQSPVEAVLRQDPVHPAMDPGTRDRYRKTIEGLARRCHPPGAEAERAVAETALALAQVPSVAAAGSPAAHPAGPEENPAEQHVGWWLIGDGRRRLASGRLGEVILTMWPAPAAGILAILLAGFRPGMGVVAIPLGILWILAPVVAWSMSRPRRSSTAILGQSERRYLDVCARKTWRFFTENWTAEDCYLPPDNVQDEPVQVIAHRTSPTNINLALLADLAAHDLGWLTTGGLIRRLDLTWAATSTLARYRGHLFNWYDTRTGQVLAPRYISTVDSGNLAGHLLVLAAGLRALPASVDLSRRRRGLAATISCAGTPEALALAKEV